MTKYKNKTFSDQIIPLDGNEYEHCTLKGCTLEYRGYFGFGMENTRLDGCTLALDGPAHLTLWYMRYIYAQFGDVGKNFIEEVFKEIRGDIPFKEKRRRWKKTFNINVSKNNQWVFMSENEKSVLGEIENDTDRAAAIIAASVVELRLKEVIQSRMYRNEKVEERLFNPSGPLGSFSAKIDLALLSGIITEDAFRDLVIIKNVRNAFAHHLDIRDFKSPSIRDQVQNLKLIDSQVGNFTGKTGERLLSTLPNYKPRLNVWNYAERKKDPRQRYLITTQLFTVATAVADMPGASVPIL